MIIGAADRLSAARSRPLPASSATIDWLLAGDPSIEFQTRRDLLGETAARLKPAQARIAVEGWGARFMMARRSDGHWGRGFYQPKWISTHYTLLDLAGLCFPPENRLVQASVDLVFDAPRGRDGGIHYAKSLPCADVCINGMTLFHAAWFKGADRRLFEIVDYLLERRMKDGGWNCDYWRGASQSSLHTTLSVLEGLDAFRKTGARHRLGEIAEAEASGREFILAHRLFRSRRTGEPIDPRFLKLTYPPRWRFDILRALDYFARAGAAYDERMGDAIEILTEKRDAGGTWRLAAPHPGQVHFDMERAGQPSRWNTLRALRVLGRFGGA